MRSAARLDHRSGVWARRGRHRRDGRCATRDGGQAQFVMTPVPDLGPEQDGVSRDMQYALMSRTIAPRRLRIAKSKNEQHSVSRLTRSSTLSVAPGYRRRVSRSRVGAVRSTCWSDRLKRSSNSATRRGCCAVGSAQPSPGIQVSTLEFFRYRFDIVRTSPSCPRVWSRRPARCDRRLRGSQPSRHPRAVLRIHLAQARAQVALLGEDRAPLEGQPCHRSQREGSP